jgi:hypothetical protein
MLGTGFPVSMYTTKTPIDKWCFNVIIMDVSENVWSSKG